MENKMFEFKEIKNKSAWEKFDSKVNTSSYFQSWQWGEVMQKSDFQVDRIGIFKENVLTGVMQCVEVKSRRGHFIHVRQGPVLLKWSPDLIKITINYLKNYAKNKKADFIRISPMISETENNEKFAKLGMLYAPVHNQDGENRWILPLDKSEDELLSNMRKTTRYMIKKAKSMNIRIEKTNKMYRIKDFINIYNQTTELKHFVAHKSISQEFEVLSKDNKAFLYFAWENNNLLAASFIVYYKNEAIYRHGATSIAGRKSPASYILQWEAIKDSKKNGLLYYDFWGISENDDPKHPWFGLSNFKKGFGGERKNYMHMIDIPLSPKYLFTYFIDFFTTVKKGYGIPHRLRVQ